MCTKIKISKHKPNVIIIKNLNYRCGACVNPSTFFCFLTRPQHCKIQPCVAVTAKTTQREALISKINIVLTG